MDRLRKAIGSSLWLVLAIVFGWIEAKVFHSDSGLGITLGIISGLFIGYALNHWKAPNNHAGR